MSANQTSFQPGHRMVKNSGSFATGHHSMHDLSAAGRASRAAGHWTKPFPKKSMLVRRLELIKRAARKE